jgi:hypothetical protein
MSADSSPSPTDRLLRFVLEHEGCGQEIEAGQIEREPDGADVNLCCPGCGATLTVPITFAESKAFLEEQGGHYSDEDIRRAQGDLQKH